MSEQTFEQMLNESFKTIHTGEAVEGSVIDVKPGEAILNIGYKSDGVLTRNEYTNDSSVDLTEVLHVGDLKSRLSRLTTATARSFFPTRDWQLTAATSASKKLTTIRKFSQLR